MNLICHHTNTLHPQPQPPPRTRLHPRAGEKSGADNHRVLVIKCIVCNGPSTRSRRYSLLVSQGRRACFSVSSLSLSLVFHRAYTCFQEFFNIFMLELSLVHLLANCLESLFFFVSPLMLFHPSTHTHGETNVGARAHIRGQSVPHALSSPQSADSLFGLQDVVGTPGAALCGLTLNYKTISQKAFELLLLPLCHLTVLPLMLGRKTCSWSFQTLVVPECRQ